ncbi:LysR family transcriptional regulator [Burkholderia sp. WAC0059]|uniref:LysR family transcriptional regulator n=1 Tax=Burkholderia sp. WAC0059 TaxID=2066022 RepID=UPI000C7F2E3B|nr:LysR family transcriptional regulator [Burkholderia sp. WAC0059]PLZ01737.1 LysR family transcriptional regulator [Burkholderia sp. WAC0059]
MKPLDIEAVQAFVLVADTHSFTRAADLLNTTQSAISIKLKRLEQRVGQQLIERTPRKVRLSPKGELFLRSARALLAAHDDAITSLVANRIPLKIGISHHLVGNNLPVLLRHLREANPHLQIELRVSSSRDMQAQFDQGQVDAAIVLSHDDIRHDGETLVQEQFGWMAIPDWTQPPDAAIPLALQAHPCRVRAMAVDALALVRIPWEEVFVGGGAATLAGAALAGLAIAPLALSAAPAGTMDIGPRIGLPVLPTREIILYSASSEPEIRVALRKLGEAFQDATIRMPAATPSHAVAAAA